MDIFRQIYSQHILNIIAVLQSFIIVMINKYKH